MTPALYLTVRDGDWTSILCRHCDTEVIRYRTPSWRVLAAKTGHQCPPPKDAA